MFCTTTNNFWVTYWPLTKAIVVRRELRSCMCSWGHDVWFTDRRHLLQQTFNLKKNFAIEIIPKEEQGWKNIRKPMGWHLKICKQCTADEEMKGLLRSLHNHRLHLRRTSVRTSDHYGSNFSYNSQVLRRKHPVLGIKLNPLSLLFQLARYPRNNTNKRL